MTTANPPNPVEMRTPRSSGFARLREEVERLKAEMAEPQVDTVTPVDTH